MFTIYVLSLIHDHDSLKFSVHADAVPDPSSVMYEAGGIVYAIPLIVMTRFGAGSVVKKAQFRKYFLVFISWVALKYLAIAFNWILGTPILGKMLSIRNLTFLSRLCVLALVPKET